MPVDDVGRALAQLRLLHQTARLRALPLSRPASGGPKVEALPLLVWYGRMVALIDGIQDEKKRKIARAIFIEALSIRETARVAGCSKSYVERMLNDPGGLWEWFSAVVDAGLW